MSPGRRNEGKTLSELPCFTLNYSVSPSSLPLSLSSAVLSLQYGGRYYAEQNIMDCFSVLLLPLCITLWYDSIVL